MTEQFLLLIVSFPFYSPPSFYVHICCSVNVSQRNIDGNSHLGETQMAHLHNIIYVYMGQKTVEIGVRGV